MINDRSVKPQPEKELEFHLPEIKKFELDNGMKVLLAERYLLPIVKLNFIADAGSVYDPDGKKGLAYLTAMLLDEGAGEYDALQLDNEIDSLGSNTAIVPAQDSCYLSLLSIKENFSRSLEVFSKVLTDPHLKQTDFEREKKNLLSRLVRLKDEPSYIAASVFSRKVFGESPYSYPTIGYEKDIEAISLDDVKNFYLSRFNPKSMYLIAAGSISEEELKKELNKNFNSWRPELQKTVPDFSPAPLKNTIFLIDKKDAPQSEIYGGHLSGLKNAPEFFPKLLVNTILGGQFSSRINLNLREDKGYTYGAHSGFSYNKNAGNFSVNASVNSENTGDAINEILKEIKGIKENIKDEEIDFAKSYLIRKFPSSFETNSQVATNLSNLVIHGLPEKYYDNYISTVKNQSKEQLQEAAEKYLKTDEMIFVVVGDKNKIIDDLKNISGYEIVETNFYGEEI